ncbi:MAG TPA: Phenylacetic acid catabolic protein, partial [Solirubrobacteraceae bacterium]
MMPADVPAASTPASTEAAATACMASLVRSLADNKAALGRRYAEWAVSAPTLESAVAAAAMAQDELGHARATYPVLKALGVEVADDDTHLDGDRRLALLDDELPDWTAFIAANLLVDGV